MKGCPANSPHRVLGIVYGTRCRRLVVRKGWNAIFSLLLCFIKLDKGCALLNHRLPTHQQPWNVSPDLQRKQSRIITKDRNTNIRLCVATEETSEEKAEDPTVSFLTYMFCRRGCQGEDDAFKLQINPETGCRGIYVSASDGIQKGDYIFAIPFQSAWIIETEGVDDLHEFPRDELSDAERGLRFLEWRKERENDIDWIPYFNMLPSRETNAFFDPTPDFWTEAEIRRLELPIAVESALEKRRQIMELALESSRMNASGNNSKTTEADLRFATWLVNSRAVTVLLDSDGDEEHCDADGSDTELIDDEYADEDFMTSCVLVPLLDMINHSSEDPNAHFAVLGGDEEDEDEGTEELFFAAVAGRDINQGEEVLISYGSEQDSTVDLLLQYGFVPSKNPFDVDFWEDCASENMDFIDGSCWSTSLEEDITELASLSESQQSNDKSESADPEFQRETAVMSTTLEFRIRMKRAFLEWKASQ